MWCRRFSRVRTPSVGVCFLLRFIAPLTGFQDKSLYVAVIFQKENAALATVLSYGQAIDEEHRLHFTTDCTPCMDHSNTLNTHLMCALFELLLLALHRLFVVFFALCEPRKKVIILWREFTIVFIIASFKWCSCYHFTSSMRRVDRMTLVDLPFLCARSITRAKRENVRRDQKSERAKRKCIFHFLFTPLYGMMRSDKNYAF